MFLLSAVDGFIAGLVTVASSMGNRDPVLKFVVQNRITTYSKNGCKVPLIPAWKVRFRIIAKSLNVQRITGNAFYDTVVSRLQHLNRPISFRRFSHDVGPNKACGYIRSTNIQRKVTS